MTAKEQEDREFNEKLEEIARQHGATYRGESREPGDLKQELERQARNIEDIKDRVARLEREIKRQEGRT